MSKNEEIEVSKGEEPLRYKHRIVRNYMYVIEVVEVNMSNTSHDRRKRPPMDKGSGCTEGSSRRKLRGRFTDRSNLANAAVGPKANIVTDLSAHIIKINKPRESEKDTLAGDLDRARARADDYQDPPFVTGNGSENRETEVTKLSIVDGDRLRPVRASKPPRATEAIWCRCSGTKACGAPTCSGHRQPSAPALMIGESQRGAAAGRILRRLVADMEARTADMRAGDCN